MANKHTHTHASQTSKKFACQQLSTENIFATKLAKFCPTHILVILCLPLGLNEDPSTVSSEHFRTSCTAAFLIFGILCDLRPLSPCNSFPSILGERINFFVIMFFHLLLFGLLTASGVTLPGLLPLLGWSVELLVGICKEVLALPPLLYLPANVSAFFLPPLLPFLVRLLKSVRSTFSFRSRVVTDDVEWVGLAVMALPWWNGDSGQSPKFILADRRLRSEPRLIMPRPSWSSNDFRVGVLGIS